MGSIEPGVPSEASIWSARACSPEGKPSEAPGTDSSDPNQENLGTSIEPRIDPVSINGRTATCLHATRTSRATTRVEEEKLEVGSASAGLSPNPFRFHFPYPYPYPYPCRLSLSRFRLIRFRFRFRLIRFRYPYRFRYRFRFRWFPIRFRSWFR